MYTKVLAILILISQTNSSYVVRYDNYSLVSLTPQEPDQLKFLFNLKKQKYLDVTFWKGPSKLFEDVQFIVNPKDSKALLERTRHFGLVPEIVQRDIQSAFDQQIIRKYYRSQTEKFQWDNYHTLEDINQWLLNTAEKYPNAFHLDVIGRSAEGRDINAVIFKRPNAKYKVIVEGGVHGNEWIAVEFMTYLIDQLIVNQTDNPMFDDISWKYHWYVIPVVNPDGFAYSHNVDRMWRKNRRVVDNGVGVDLNRNFDYNFGTFGTSDSEKEDTFCGPHPVSESETRAISEFVSNNRVDLRFYFSFHSYGQKIIIPYADRIKHIDNYGEMENYGRQAIHRMYQATGVRYSIGTMYDTLGIRVSGNSASWVKKTFNVRYVYTFLLRDKGTYGFALPPEYILPTCKETLIGITEIMTAKRKRLSNFEMFSSTSKISVNFVFLLCAAALACIL